MGEGKRERERESGGSEMRGDLPLWWTRSPEDEVPEVPPQAHEHQTLSWAHPLPRPLQDPLAYHPWDDSTQDQAWSSDPCTIEGL